MTETEQAIWNFLHRHLHSIFTRDAETYKAATVGASSTSTNPLPGLRPIILPEHLAFLT